jgi:hypothetical protein
VINLKGIVVEGYSNVFFGEIAWGSRLISIVGSEFQI